MYSDAGFDVSKCGRFLALCELDTATASGYHLKTVSLQPRSLGQVLQTVALPNCPYVTSVQFSPLVASVLIGYGRCQQPPPNATNEPPTYAVLRCVAFRGDSKQEAAATVLGRPTPFPAPLAHAPLFAVACPGAPSPM